MPPKPKAPAKPIKSPPIPQSGAGSKGKRRPLPGDFETVWEMMGDKGYSMRKACRFLGLHVQSFSRSVRDDDTKRGQYALAREEMADFNADRHSDVMNGMLTGKIKADVGRGVLSGLQWVAAKASPKSYGDKVALVGGGPDDGPMKIDLTTLNECDLNALADIVDRAAVTGGGPR